MSKNKTTSRILEFFQDDSKELSMSRLAVLLGLVFTTFLATIDNTPAENVTLFHLLKIASPAIIGLITYAVGKVSDAKAEIAETVARIKGKQS